MRNAYRHATGGLIALGVSAGCSSGPATPSGTEPVPVEKVEQSIQQSFERLNALHIVAAGRLVLDLPAEATACYSLPCPGSGWEQPYNAERARQAPRLEHLTNFAEAAAQAQYLALRDKSEAQAAIQALNALSVIEVGGLVAVMPANNPQCYNLPCQTDIDAADRVNSARVTQVFGIVDAAKKSGL